MVWYTAGSESSLGASVRLCYLNTGLQAWVMWDSVAGPRSLACHWINQKQSTSESAGSWPSFLSYGERAPFPLLPLWALASPARVHSQCQPSRAQGPAGSLLLCVQDQHSLLPSFLYFFPGISSLLSPRLWISSLNLLFISSCLMTPQL